MNLHSLQNGSDRIKQQFAAFWPQCPLTLILAPVGEKKSGCGDALLCFLENLRGGFKE
jgi:hypothetical protein